MCRIEFYYRKLCFRVDLCVAVKVGGERDTRGPRHQFGAERGSFLLMKRTGGGGEGGNSLARSVPRVNIKMSRFLSNER